jgi:acid phosphatase family membrane protein YuiD
MQAEPRFDIWHVVLLGVVAGQVLKLVLYSVAQRRLHLAVLGQSAGLPSMHAVVGGTLLTLCVIRTGWYAPESSIAFVFFVITVFDAMRVRAAAQQQRRLVHGLVLMAPEDGTWLRLVARYLDMIAHTPAHVAAGVVWGFLFALALGTV